MIEYQISQSDIANGTLILDKPGYYKVMEDLSFNPNPVGTKVFGRNAYALGLQSGATLDAYTAGRPLLSQFSMPDGSGGSYNPKAYGVGFFAMLSFTGGASGSVLDLNGFTIEQSQEHALNQRFYANIETAGAPFVVGQGPHDFGPEGLDAVNHLVVKNGTIGRSSHHGIHGNGNKNIIIEDVKFVDYEVGAVALNGVQGLTVRDVEASNRTDVPVHDTYSNARFISTYVNHLALLDRHSNSGVQSLRVNGEYLTASDIQRDLSNSIKNVFDDVITSGDGVIDTVDSDYYLYHNEGGLVTANSYGFLTGPVGVQVHGFPDPPSGGFQSPSLDVLFEDVEVTSQHSAVEEVAVLSNNLNGGMSQPVLDPIGAALMLRNHRNGFYNTLETSNGDWLSADSSNQDILDANYRGNPVSNAQVFVAKNRSLFAGSNLDVSRMTIGQDIIDWVESDAELSQLRSSLDQVDGWIYNVDNMMHVNKGTIAFKMDGVTGLEINDVTAENVIATGQLGFDGDYIQGSSRDTLTGYQGAAAYGFTFSGSSDVVVNDASVDHLSSDFGSSYGFASPLQNTTNIAFNDVEFENISASGLPTIGPNAAGQAFDFLVSEACLKFLLFLPGQYLFLRMFFTITKGLPVNVPVVITGEILASYGKNFVFHSQPRWLVPLWFYNSGLCLNSCRDRDCDTSRSFSAA